MGEGPVKRERGIAYGSGQLLDLFQPAAPRGPGVVVLWHGRGACERDVLEPLAHQIAAAGVGVIVPDWSTRDGTDGRRHLTASLSFIRHRSTSTEAKRITLAGWSLGASAGLDLIRRPVLLDGWRPAAFVGLSGGFDGSPFSSGQPGPVDPSVPLLLVHGSSDEVVPVERSRRTFDQLGDEGWHVRLHEVATDHAGVIGTVYDPALHRCVPTTDPSRQELLRTIATLIADHATAD